MLPHDLLHSLWPFAAGFLVAVTLVWAGWGDNPEGGYKIRHKRVGGRPAAHCNSRRVVVRRGG